MHMITRFVVVHRFILFFTHYRIKAHQNMEEDPYDGSTEEEDDDKEGVYWCMLLTTSITACV